MFLFVSSHRVPATVEMTTVEIQIMPLLEDAVKLVLVTHQEGGVAVP